MAKVSRCRSCGAEIYWLKHETTGRLAPIDMTPSPRGSCLVNLEQGAYRIAFERSSGTLYTSHFATCPQAGQHDTKAPAHSTFEGTGARLGSGVNRPDGVPSPTTASPQVDRPSRPA
jgi:hypothetical protein